MVARPSTRSTVRRGDGISRQRGGVCEPCVAVMQSMPLVFWASTREIVSAVASSIDGEQLVLNIGISGVCGDHHRYGRSSCLVHTSALARGGEADSICDSAAR